MIEGLLWYIRERKSALAMLVVYVIGLAVGILID